MNYSTEGNHSEKLEKVDRTVDQMSSEKKDAILTNFETFKEYLGVKVAVGKKMGLTEEQLAIAAEKVGDYLAKKEDPRNSEEKLLQELWKSGSQDERHMLSHMLVKLVG